MLSINHKKRLLYKNRMRQFLRSMHSSLFEHADVYTVSLLFPCDFAMNDFVTSS